MHSFELEDADGSMHQYELELHPGLVGAGVAFQLQGLAVTPILLTIRTVGQAPAMQRLALQLQGHDDGSTSEEVIGDAMGELINALQEIDFNELAASIRDVLTTPQGPKLVMQVLSHTKRDGKPLKVQHNFDTAYAGNYAELLLAIYEAVQANGFFPLAKLLQSSKLASLVDQEPTPPTASPPETGEAQAVSP